MDNGKAQAKHPPAPHAAPGDGGEHVGYKGERLGLPAEGPGSPARPGRRLAAIAADWGLCLLIAYGLLATDRASLSNWTLLVFVVLSILTVGTLGSTPGKRLLGLRVVALDGARLSLPRAVARTVLLALAVPALIWDADGRGMHDRLAGAVQVRI